MEIFIATLIEVCTVRNFCLSLLARKSRLYTYLCVCVYVCGAIDNLHRAHTTQKQQLSSLQQSLTEADGSVSETLELC